MIGDDFVSNTFHQYYQDAERRRDLYMKNNYDIATFSSKSRDAQVRSYMGRIINLFAKAINDKTLLPKAVIFIMDDDWLRSLGDEAEETNLSVVLNKLVNHLFNEIRKMIESRKDRLPHKSLRIGYPRIYWAEAPQHTNFPNNFSRRKLNSVLQANTNMHSNMQMLRMKKIWDAENINLFQRGRYTAEGLVTYWSSIDSAFEFNDKIRKESSEFFSKKKFNKGRYQWHKDGNYKQNNKDFKREEPRFKLPNPNRT